jgi:hypothetical protein
MRIALHGPLYSGKTTLAHQLVNVHGFTLVNYTDYLKNLTAIMFNAIGKPLTVEQIKADKATWRPFLQSLGTRVGFDEGEYVEQCLREQAGIEYVYSDPARSEWLLDSKIVFDNVRTQAQLDILRPYGFKLVRLTIPYSLQIERANVLGVSGEELVRVNLHNIEHGLPEQDEEIRLSAECTVENSIASLLYLLEIAA